ncbi:hypothetical protein PENTCL1PPCAC_14037, partial [Pristionchus entomophagus]
EYERVSRRVSKREGNAKTRHNLKERTGQNVIIRGQLGERPTSFESEDAFGVTCDNVTHSLNKGRRWEKTANAEQVLYNMTSPGKTSLVDATVPGGRSMISCTGSNVDHCTITNQKGGIKKYVEVEDGEIKVRKAKSTRTNLASLQSTAGTGPLLKANRHRSQKGGKDGEEEKRALSDPSEQQHTRYSTLELKKINPKAAERSWR